MCLNQKSGTWTDVLNKLLHWSGCSVTYEQLLPSCLREHDAHHLKIKTSTVISCSSGCFTEKSEDMNCIFHPLQSWLLGASLSAASVFHGGLRNKPPKMNYRGVCCICVKSCSSLKQKRWSMAKSFLLPCACLVCLCTHPCLWFAPHIFLRVKVWMWLPVCLDPPFSLPLTPSVRCQQHIQLVEGRMIGVVDVVGGSNRAISQVPVQPTIPQGVSVNAEAHGVSAEKQGCLSKGIQCEGSC